MHNDVTSLLSSSRLLEGLENANPTLYRYVLASCSEVLPVLRTIPDAFGEYTDHGVQHSRRVFELGQALLGPVELDPWETAVFTLACFYHDVGMACPRDAWDELEDSEGFRKEEALIREFVLPSVRLTSEEPEDVRTQTITEYLRRHHGERSRRWILDNRSELDADSIIDGVYLWDQVARIGLGHTLEMNQVDSDPSYQRNCPIGTARGVDVLFLTCLLRLSDICHLSRDRALPHVRNSLRFKSRLSEEIWRAHGDMAGVTCDRQRSVIVVRGEPRDFDSHRLIHEAVLGIRRELDNCHRLLAGAGRSLPWKFVDSTQIRPAPDARYEFVEQGRFRLDEDRIVRLLMGSRLYAEPLYALRECVQNSLDAISVVRLEQPSFNGAIIIRYTDASGPYTLEIFDNGTGMDRQIVIEHLLAAGARPFVQSERRARDWGQLQKGTAFIARHGIGFLSCFMIAHEVEVYSQYRGAVPIAIRIDSPTRNVEFLKTSQHAGFPTWGERGPSLPTPWQAGHGTCIRLRLTQPLAVDKLMEFIATDLPRVRARLFVAYNEQWVPLRENWRKARGWRTKSNSATLAELEEELFGLDSRRPSFYDGPPQDAALAVKMITSGDIRGFVTLSPDDADSSNRITQDGILIRDGAEGLWVIGTQTSGSIPPFSFDIDVAGGLQLELDAERARIVDTEENADRCRRITDWIEENGLASLGALESSLFFPCGGAYYHGGMDLLQGHSHPTLHFHRSLRRWYTLERLRNAVERYGEKPFLSAQLYVMLGEGRNTPVSLRDLQPSGRELFVLVPGRDSDITSVDALAYGDADRDKTHDSSVAFQTLLTELRRYGSLDHLLVALDERDFFALPLLCCYEVRSRDKLSSSGACVLRLRRRTAWSFPEEGELSSSIALFSGADFS